MGVRDQGFRIDGSPPIGTFFEMVHLARREYTADRIDFEKQSAPGVFTRG
jgi:hypothetical protein